MPVMPVHRLVRCQIGQLFDRKRRRRPISNRAAPISPIPAASTQYSWLAHGSPVGEAGTVEPDVTITETDVVSFWPLAPLPLAVTTHVTPGTALLGIVIEVVKLPDELAVTVKVSMPQTLSFTEVPGA